MAKDPKPDQQAEAEEQTPDVRAQLLEGQETPEAEPKTEPKTEPAAPQPEPETPEKQPEPAPETPEAEPTSEQEPEDFLAKIRNLGWDGESVDQAQDALLEAFQRQASEYTQMQQRIQEQEELARYGTQFLREQREREEAEAKAAQAKEPEKPESWWSPPRFDPAQIERYRDVRLDANGNPELTWKDNTPREIIESARAYQDYLDKWATDLVQRPHEVLPKVIEQEFNRLFDERFSEREQAATVESFAQEVREANKDWMYTVNERGEEVLTSEGQRMTELLAETAQAGITDPRTQWEYAVARYDWINRARQQNTQPAPEAAKETAAKKRKEHVDRGSNRPMQNRAGTVPRPDEQNETPQNPHLTPGQQLVEQLKLDGQL